jgi:hypothetical protein
MTFPSNTRIDRWTDAGTVWTMRHAAQVARCALMSTRSEWELRIIIDGVTRASQRCERGGQAFELADTWKHHMLDEGWRQVVPSERHGGHPTTLGTL